MVRKLAPQVPQFVSRLLQANLLPTPPTWYQPVLSNPPPILPPRQVIPRSRPSASVSLYPDLPRSSTSSSSTSSSSSSGLARGRRYPREPKPKPQAIVYDEDRIRRQFFKDFPFEAFRPVSLVEGPEISEEHVVKGSEWTKLEQRGSYPTVEDAIAFTVTLHKEHNLSLSDAYEQATSEFVALRAKHEMATLAAEDQARSFGAQFKRDPWDRAYDQETRALSQSTSSSSSSLLSSSSPSTKFRKPTRWTSSIPPSTLPSIPFSSGVNYASRWSMPASGLPTSTGPTQGDLVSTIGSGTVTESENDGEPKESHEGMSDFDLLHELLQDTVQEEVKNK